MTRDQRQMCRAIALAVAFGGCMHTVTLFTLPRAVEPRGEAIAGDASAMTTVQAGIPSVSLASTATAELAPSLLGLASFTVLLAASTRASRSFSVKSGRRIAMRAAATEEATEAVVEEEEPAAAEEVVVEPPKKVFDPARQVGITEPLGFFDPLGFCKKGDKKGFRKLREAELKHGRVAMMASAGLVVPHWYQFPFFDCPSGIYAPTETPAREGLALIVLISGFLELILWRQSDDKAIGDFGDPLGFNIYDRDMRNRELNNGRLAMFTSIGMIAAELYTGKDSMMQIGFSERFMSLSDAYA